MSQLADTSVSILDGNVILFRRPRSSLWQAKFTIERQNSRISTKTADLAKAKEFALDAYMRAKFRISEGLPAVTKTFKSVATLAVKQLQDSLDAGVGKVVYKDYIEVINKYHIPFFGNYAIHNIDHIALAQFNKWRIEQFKGKLPAFSTITTHNSALNRVFDAALERGFITKSQLPNLTNDGAKGERRPDFTIAEWRKLTQFNIKWCEAGKKGMITDKRQILRDYMLFLSNTGCRPGTETQGLKWKHIRLELHNDIEYVVITVDGKTKRRELVARHGIVRPLERLLHRQAKYANLTLRDALRANLDAYVFALPNGKEVKKLEAPFKILLTESGLLVDPRSEQNRTLYSIRHMYITLQLLKGTSASIVAKHCGTSTAMIDRFYSHVTSLLTAKEFAGKKNKKTLELNV